MLEGGSPRPTGRNKLTSLQAIPTVHFGPSLWMVVGFPPVVIVVARIVVEVLGSTTVVSINDIELAVIVVELFSCDVTVHA